MTNSALSKPWCNLLSLIVLPCFACLPSTAAKAPPTREFFVYFGTYTGAKSKGIYRCKLQVPSAQVSTPELAAELTSPSFLAIHPSGRYLYAVNEVNRVGAKPGGGVSSFRIDPKTGSLTALNQESSVGTGPCHLTVDGTGRFVLVANYGGGSVAVLPIQPDGSLGPSACFVQHEGSSINPQRQQSPHAHGVYMDAANRFAMVPDLGLDRVLVYRLDVNSGMLTPHSPAFASLRPGAGPRHLAMHSNSRFAYVINELDCTVTAFRFNAIEGTFSELETVSTLPKGEMLQPGFSTAEIEVHPSGRFLYGSNRGHDSIVSYRVSASTGRLSDHANTPTQGKTPRSFGIDPTGQFLFAANQGSDNVVIFAVDQKTGRLSPTGQQLSVGAPVCVKFLPVNANPPAIDKK